MAIVQNPITGRSSGALSNFVFSTRYKKNIVRSKPMTVANPRTAAQTAQRTKFASAVQFYQLYRVVLDYHLHSFSKTMSMFNQFMSWNVNAFNPAAAGILAAQIPRLIFGKGNLDTVFKNSLAASATHGISVAASVIPNPNIVKSSDVLCILVYNPTAKTLNKYEQTRPNIGTVMTTSPQGVVGETVYVFAMTHDESVKKHSTSVYFGSVVLI